MPRNRLQQVAIAVLVVAAVNAFLFWIRTLGQPLIDAQSFRQTQTALTAFWLQPDLASILNYETPVLGAPWSVPFEFPLFQLIVAALANTTGMDLSFCGRLVSLLFGLGSMAVVLALLSEYGFSRLTRILFATLYLASSVYLYWNRAFMIESTALFFTLLSLFLAGRSLSATDSSSRRSLAGFLPALGCGLSLILALLVKATTAMPAFLLLACLVLWRLVASIRCRSRAQLTTCLMLLAGLLTAFLLLRGWTHHADALKSLNPYGSRLTSTALQGWNFGRFEQRFSSDLWKGVVIKRLLTKAFWLPVVLLLLAGLWSLRRQKLSAAIVVVSLVLWLMPMLIFTNLHIVHDYYQAANQVFLLVAIAASGASLIEQEPRPGAARVSMVGLLRVFAAVVMIAYVAADGKRFDRIYRPQANQASDSKLVVSRFIDRSVDKQSAILVVGDDWYSSFAYLSRRRSLTIPEWFPSGPYSETGVLADPRSRIAPYKLGAVISRHELPLSSLAPICPSVSRPQLSDAGPWNVYLCSPATGVEPVRHPPDPQA